MNQRWIALTLLAMPFAASAAQSASDAEPAVVTSPAAATRSAAPATSPATTPPALDRPSGSTPASSRASAPASGPAAPASAPASAPSSVARPPATSPPARGNADRIELEATQITGNAELPRVMYVVPWKRAELGDLAGRPAKSLLDEVLTPVDRDVFRRQNRYYEALQPDVAKAAPEGEK